MRKADKIKTLKKKLKKHIKSLLREHNKKMTVSDINSHLKHKNLDEIKGLCKEMYQNNNISYAGNGRYFVLTEEADEKKKTKTPKVEKSEEVDVKSELKKYKEMLDEGLIDKEDYEAKKKELLSL